MSSFLFIYLCFNVYKTSNISHFLTIKYCKYTVRAKQQFQKKFIMYISSINIQVSEHFYASKEVDKIFLMYKFSNTTIWFDFFFVQSLNRINPFVVYFRFRG